MDVVLKRDYIYRLKLHIKAVLLRLSANIYKPNLRINIKVIAISASYLIPSEIADVFVIQKL